MSRKRPKRWKEDDSVDKDVIDKGSEEKEQKREEYDAFGFMKNKKQTAAVAGAFFVVGFLISWLVNPSLDGMVIGRVSMASADQVGNDVVGFINDNLLVEGYTASLRNVTEKDNMYEVSIDVIQDGAETGQNVNFYVSGDGNLLFFNEPVDMSQPLPVPEETEQTDMGVPKSDKPVANVFVMSYCPYGLQMEKAVIPVMELLGDKADINIDYVSYVMHGEKEMIQNNNQYCIQKEQPEKFAAYMRCFVQSDDHAKCMTEAGVDSAKLDSCLADLETEFDVTNVFESSGDQYPPYPVDAVLAEQYGVRGSPTFVLNGQVISVNRSPEAVKQAICDAFNTPPEECSQTLGSEAAAAGIGAMSGGTDSAASCG